MNATECGRAFQLRLYQWAKQDFLREIEEAFPLTRSINSPGPKVLIGMMERLSASEKKELALALVKRRFSRVLDEAHETITTREHEYCESYLRELSARNEQCLEVGITLNKKQLVKEVVDRAGNDLGGEGIVQPYEPTIRYITVTKNWKVLTQVAIGDKYRHLTYTQGILSPDESFRPGEHISILSWMGLGMTGWVLKSKSEIDEAVGSLLTVSKHFLEAAPTLLEGLEYEA